MVGYLFVNKVDVINGVGIDSARFIGWRYVVGIAVDFSRASIPLRFIALNVAVGLAVNCNGLRLVG